MKDARGIDIKVGDQVVLLKSKDMDFGTYYHPAWGEVLRFTKKMVVIRVGEHCGLSQETNRAPHNIVVCKLPLSH